MAESQIREWQRRIGVVTDGHFGQVTLETSIDILEELERLKGPKPLPVPGPKPLYSIQKHYLFKGNEAVNQKPSGNHGGQIVPQIVVVHYTGDNLAQGAVAWLCNPDSGVSAHLVVAKTGQIWQLVPFNIKAWHAGVSSWNGKSIGRSVNGFSIGIENVGLGDEWPEAQIQANIDVIKALMVAYPSIEEVVGHDDVTSRKVDPGPLYPWDRVREAVRLI